MKKIAFFMLLFFVFPLISNAGNGLPTTDVMKVLQGLEQKSQRNVQTTHSSKPLPSLKEICEHLVDIDSWRSEGCDKFKAQSEDGRTFIKVQRDYARNGKSVSVVVITGLAANSNWLPFSSNLIVDNDKALIRVTSIEGHRAGINYDKIEHKGSIVIPLVENVKEQVPKAIFMLEFENMGYEDALGFVDNFDLDSLVDLFN